MRSLFRLSALLTLALAGLAAGSASAMPMWAHGIDPAQHRYLRRVALIAGVAVLGAALARVLDARLLTRFSAAVRGRLERHAKRRRCEIVGRSLLASGDPEMAELGRQILGGRPLAEAFGDQ